ncbi:zinc-finger of a C2HC-type [Phytophthora infestans]|uniref:Zinc-finger of a C2HC-type n=1 Tax=Phytophthora infestans TaxID=4787 RepID=A0A833TFJ8_PHYIN|nr:zinc-finger of a C2HC-type [Phytophthora infestans]KAF4150573.1 zinc-finger of a C2HC-type [Phytophthora infestans]
MSDLLRLPDASVSGLISHDPEPRETSELVEQVEETQVQTSEDENAPEQRRWGSETSHQSEDDDDEGWMVTPLIGRQDVHISTEEMTEADEADVEASVREALRLLEDSTEDADEEESEREGEQWKAERAETVYLDFVHEVMEDRWMLDDRDEQHNELWRTTEEQVDSDDEDNEERSVHEDNKEDTEKSIDYEQDKEQEHQDEWQEAYTAKGRVYYYNRRTRESSWKKPSHYNSSSNQPQPSAVDTGEESELHHSVLRQSLGYHPSASPSASPMSNIERQATLYCNFCGEQQPADQLATHFQDCASVKFHRRRLSPLYMSFERALGAMSEDSTLRSLHYASSFPDPIPHRRPEATTMQDSLVLLRPRRRRTSRSSTESTPQKPRTTQSRIFGTTENGLKVSPTKQEVPDTSPSRPTTQTATAKRKKKSVAKRKSSQAPTTAISGGSVTQNMETCRYCNRSFAEGRLAKHEAVCPRVFGNEGSWGRGTPSSQTSPLQPKSTGAGTPPSSVGSIASKMHKLKDHTLQQSYKEHQATLVLCPCCRRKFAPSGAQEHIAICKGVQNRPKNPIPLLRDYAMAG